MKLFRIADSGFLRKIYPWYYSEHDGSTCHCNPGFYGDGFECEYFGLNVNSGECKRHSQCLNSEKCVMIFDDRSTFTFSCVKKDPKEIIEGKSDPQN